MLAMLLWVPLVLAEPPGPSGIEVLRAEGCLSCHPGGGRGVGPDLTALVGRTEAVVRDGTVIDVVVDAAYIRRALTEPNTEVVVGFPPGIMPTVTDPARVDALVAAVTVLTPTPRPSSAWLAAVLLGGVAFVGGHLVLSGRLVRDRVVARLGEYGFMGAYSIVIGLGLGLLVYGWTKAPYVELWAPSAWTRWVPALVMPWVMIMQVAGYSTPSPTIAGMASTLGESPRGIHRITRHPVNISTSIWALAHLFPNGDVASVGLFGAILVLGVVGSLHIDRRLARRSPEAWARYAAVTSVVPFAAIASGRNSFSFSEVGVLRIVGGLALYALILGGHAWMIGASPWP